LSSPSSSLLSPCSPSPSPSSSSPSSSSSSPSPAASLIPARSFVSVVREVPAMAGQRPPPAGMLGDATRPPAPASSAQGAMARPPPPSSSTPAVAGGQRAVGGQFPQQFALVAPPRSLFSRHLGSPGFRRICRIRSNKVSSRFQVTRQLRFISNLRRSTARRGVRFNKCQVLLHSRRRSLHRLPRLRLPRTRERRRRMRLLRRRRLCRRRCLLPSLLSCRMLLSLVGWGTRWVLSLCCSQLPACSFLV
jgi:hypothetical protein